MEAHTTTLRTFADASDFLEVVGSTLLSAEAEESLLLGIALRLRDGHRYGDQPPFLACVEEGDRFPAIAVWTPPYNLCLSAHASCNEALAALAESLIEAGQGLPGVQGEVSAATAFAALWQASTGASPAVGMEQRLYRLTAVTAPTGVSGRPRWATPRDADLLAEWAAAFVQEAVPYDPNPRPRETIERAVQARNLLVWEDGGLVSMCGRSRPTPHGASLSLVYTPPALRGRGYASACVAELSQRILDSGKTFCTLFADLANPTSNAIYQRIGYQPLRDFREIRFGPQPLRASLGASGRGC